MSTRCVTIFLNFVGLDRFENHVEISGKRNIYCEIFQRKFGKRLQNEWPRIKMLLKRYEAGYVRKVASIFTRFHIRQAIQLDYNSPKWILRKAAIVIAYCGGLRGAELRSIKIGDITVDNEGLWVRYDQVRACSLAPMLHMHSRIINLAFYLTISGKTEG